MSSSYRETDVLIKGQNTKCVTFSLPGNAWPPPSIIASSASTVVFPTFTLAVKQPAAYHVMSCHLYLGRVALSALGWYQ